MAKTIRSEAAANALLAGSVINQQARRMAQESERAEWRRVLDRREARQVKAWNTHLALTRQQKHQTGAVVFGMLASLASFAAIVLARFHG